MSNNENNSEIRLQICKALIVRGDSQGFKFLSESIKQKDLTVGLLYGKVITKKLSS